ncbi:MAG: orotidine-5'-phosphate decarboxylase [Acidimicrobiia bacterium]
MTRLFVALDVPTTDEAVLLARSLAPHVDGFKVGLELLLGAGPKSIKTVAELGKPVFADAKLLDIPNTVERAARQLGKLGARYVTVHAGGGEEMIAAACRGLADGAIGKAGILAVTVLTSLDEAVMASVGILDSTKDQVVLLAKLAAAGGAEGVVCSVAELEVVREAAPGLLRVTPGIRMDNANHDQRRVAGPSEAARLGADILVVGRPIISAEDPVAAAMAIAQDMRP